MCFQMPLNFIAYRCIVAVIKDPSILDHGCLMSLKPVQFLEGEPIHKVSKKRFSRLLI